MRARLRARFQSIASGEVIGRRRHDLPHDLPLRFVDELPFVIAFDANTRVIVRVLHGRRDFPALFG
jgi:plasmid stabilization system protein ParE